MTNQEDFETFHCRHCNAEVFSGNMFCDDCERELNDLAEEFEDDEE